MYKWLNGMNGLYSLTNLCEIVWTGALKCSATIRNDLKMI